MSSHPSSTRRRLIAVAVTVAIAAVGLTGCATGTAQSAPGKELNVVLPNGPGTLDPALINQANQWYVDLAYSPLIQVGSDGTTRPGLATKWGYVGSTNTEFQLKLRKGVVFSDGSALTADAVKKHLEYVQSAKGATGIIIAGATITAVDDLTVDIKLPQPNPNLPYYFAQSGVGLADVISPAGLKDPAALGTKTFGSGPYMLDAAATVANDHYVYVPNPHYWDKGNVHWKKVTIKVISNVNSILNALKTGQADFTSGDYTTAADAEKSGLTVHFVPNVFSGLNLLDRGGKIVPALGDVRVRQAINYAIDRTAIVKAIYGKYGEATTQTTHDVGFQADLDKKYAYNPTKAKQLLKEAGYENGFEFSVASTPFFNGDTLVQAIAGQLAKVGITLKADSIADANDWATKMASGTYPAAWIGYGSQPMFVEGQGLYLPYAFFNAFKGEDAQITSLYGQLAVAPQDQVKSLSEKIESRLVDLAWYAPVVWSPLGSYATSKIDPKAITSTTGQAPIVAIIDLKPKK